MEEDFYATIKLKSGEEIFAKINYDEDHDRCFLILDNPITIERIKTRSASGYKVEPWIKTSKEELFVINIDDVIAKINKKTKMISLVHMSNVTGSITDFHKINKVAMFDQFPYSNHIESGVVLERITPSD